MQRKETEESVLGVLRDPKHTQERQVHAGSQKHSSTATHLWVKDNVHQAADGYRPNLMLYNETGEWLSASLPWATVDS